MTEDDNVPDGKLLFNDVSAHSAAQLKCWLLCRELKTGPTKIALSGAKGYIAECIPQYFVHWFNVFVRQIYGYDKGIEPV